MNSDIKDIVESLKIHEKKEELKNKKEKLYNLSSEMSRMTFNRTVGLYAFYTDEINYLTSKIDDNNREDSLNKIKEYNEKGLKLLENEDVRKYASLRDEYYNTMFDKETGLRFDSDYNLTINKCLRKELTALDLPNIFVKQSRFDYDKNIVNPYVFYDEFDNNSSEFVFPVYEMESCRDFRHFYNRVSFRYLEELCNDYSFDLEGKNIGKVIVLKR